MMDLPTISDIDAERRTLGISIAELCERAAVSRSAYFRAKANTTGMTMLNARRLVDALNAARGTLDAA